MKSGAVAAAGIGGVGMCTLGCNLLSTTSSSPAAFVQVQPSVAGADAMQAGFARAWQADMLKSRADVASTAVVSPGQSSVVVAALLGASAAGVWQRSNGRARKGLRKTVVRSSGIWMPHSVWPPPEAAEEPAPGKDEPRQTPPVRMPMIETGSGSIDVMSRLLQDRILILGGQVNDEMANVLIAQMLYLANKDSKADITIYINSPGGSVSAGLAIFDSMQFVPCDVSTVCFGMAASMGAFLLGAGTKGKRKALPNSRVMIHQPLGGAGGQAADIEIQAKEILFLRELLNTYLSDFSGQSMAKVEADCDRDYFMTPEEAVEYGLIDQVVKTKSWPRLQKPPKPNLNVAMPASA